jgi:rhodanese-related sulfurtransferase
MKTLRLLMAALAAALLLNALAACEEAPRKTAEELKAMLGAPDLVVLDVRTEYDWKSSSEKIKGAVRENPLDADSWAGKYPKDKTMVLY